VTYLHYAGVDLGQSQDPSALVIVAEPLHVRYEWARALNLQGVPEDGWLWDVGALTAYQRQELRSLNYWRGRPADPPLRVQWVERLPLRTPYPEVVKHVGRLLDRPPLEAATTALVVDQTGVGRPVLDAMRLAGQSPIGITITAGYATVVVPPEEGGGYRVPKRDLVSVVAVLLEQRRLHITDALPAAATLRRELETFRRKSTPDGSDTYSSWREGDHDDTVLALAVACWYRQWWNGRVDLANAEVQRSTASV
jgi:hypothetical protein